MEPADIKKRLMLRLFGEPVTLTLGLGGAMALLSSPFFGLSAAIPAFIGVTGLAGAAGILAVRGILNRDDLTQKLIEEIAAEEASAHEARLDRLQERLETARDPRTGPLFADIRMLVQTVREDASWQRSMNSVAAADVALRIDQLFRGCIQSLEHSLELRETAVKLTTPAAREPLKRERANILDEVERTVTRLGRLLTELRVLDASETDTTNDLSRIRDQLDSNLEAIRATVRETSRFTEVP